MDDIGVTIPNQLYGRKWVIPAEIHSADLWPMRRKIHLLDCDAMFRNWEYPAGTQDRNALRSRFDFMWWIARNDCCLFFLGIMLHVIYRHRRDVSVITALLQKAPHDLGHAKQWGERHPNRIGANIGSGERLAVDVHWWLFIEPNPTQRLALEFLAARKIAFQADYGLAARDVIDVDAVGKSGMPRAETSSAMASFGIEPVPGSSPARPTSTRCTVSRTTSPVTPQAQPTV